MQSLFMFLILLASFFGILSYNVYKDASTLRVGEQKVIEESYSTKSNNTDNSYFEMNEED